VPFSIQKLEKYHAVAAFDCGDEALNVYLQRYALQNQERHSVGVTYAAVAQETQNAVIGYYTLAASSLPKSSLSAETARRLSPYADVPCLLLARLGVDKHFQKHGIGRRLLKDALKRCVLIRGEIGCRCLILDAYPGAVIWYQQFGFIPLRSPDPKARTQKMLMDLRTLDEESPHGL